MYNVYCDMGPQGSVLGLLLFCLHINALPSCIQNCKIHMFADDTSIQCSSSSVVDIGHSLQKDLNANQAWMNANKLKLNLAKTFVMLIGTRQTVCVQRVKLNSYQGQSATTRNNHMQIRFHYQISWS